MKSFLASAFAFVFSIAEMAHAALFGYMARSGLVLGAFKLPNGSIVEIASSYGPETDMDAVSNANPAVATVSASHGFASSDLLELTSGWSRLTNRVVKAGTPSGNNIPLLGINSTSTTRYPTGGGVGTAREILTWTQMQQITEVATEGGEQNFLTFQFLEDDTQRRIPTSKSPIGISITLADDPELAGYLLAEEANDDRTARAVRVTFPDNSVLLFKALITLQKMPSLNIDELMTVEVTFSLEGDPTRYSA